MLADGLADHYCWKATGWEMMELSLRYRVELRYSLCALLASTGSEWPQRRWRWRRKTLMTRKPPHENANLDKVHPPVHVLSIRLCSLFSLSLFLLVATSTAGRKRYLPLRGWPRAALQSSVPTVSNRSGRIYPLSLPVEFRPDQVLRCAVSR